MVKINPLTNFTGNQGDVPTKQAGNEFLPNAPVGGGGMSEIGSAILTAPNSTISVTIPAKKYLQIFVVVKNPSINAGTRIRFNADAGANYCNVGIQEGTAVPVENNSQSGRIGYTTYSGTPRTRIFSGDILNIVDVEKHLVIRTIETNASSYISWTQEIHQTVWNNTTSQITQIDIIASGGTFDTGSRIIVLGTD